MTAPAGSDAPQRGLLIWVWRKYISRYKGLVALSVGFMAVEGGMTAALAYMMKPLFDQGLLAKNVEGLAWIGIVILAIFTARGLSSIVQKTVLTQVSQLSMGDIRQDLLDHLMSLQSDFHQVHGPGYLIQRVEGDVGGVAKLWRALITSAGRDLITVIALLGTALWLDWVWTVTILVGVPLLMGPSVLLQKYVRRHARAARDISAQLSTRLNEIFHGIVPVKLNQLERYQSKQYRALTRNRVRAEVRSAAGQASLPGLIDVMSGVALAAILFFAGREIASGANSVGDFMAFLAAIGMMFEPLRRLAAVSGVWQVAAASIERIKELRETQATLRDPEAPKPAPQGVPKITLEDVHLSFGEAPALRGVSLVAEPGKTTALVGASGAGKSTIFNLLTRLLDPNQGTVRIGDVATPDMRLRDLRGLFSVVNQEAMLFDETLRENIVLGEDVDEATLKAALDAAHVSDFLPRLEKGLDTPVGPRGSNLSGGQRQRVAIARALLRDTPVLLLDEATSALDAQSEAVVQAALERLAKGRTTLVIAHRLATIRNADKIIVMDQGKVVDQGTHEELIARDGAYQDLYRLQFDQA